MSVGHLARLLEEAGIATVIIAAKAFGNKLKAMNPARVLTTNHPMGRPIGPPGDRERQLQVLNAALNLLHQAQGPGTLVEFSELYQPNVQ